MVKQVNHVCTHAYGEGVGDVEDFCGFED